jgi:hypothetical protein
MTLNCFACKTVGDINEKIEGAKACGLNPAKITLSPFTILKILKEANFGIYESIRGLYKRQGIKAFDGMEIAGLKIDIEGMRWLEGK